MGAAFHVASVVVMRVGLLGLDFGLDLKKECTKLSPYQFQLGLCTICLVCAQFVESQL